MSTHGPYVCTVCTRTMRKASDHLILDGGLICCQWCQTRPVHDELFPSCGHPEHDISDHLAGIVGERCMVAGVLARMSA